MFTLYKDGKSCTCGRDQLPAMQSAGWSLENKPAKKATKKAATKNYSVKAETGSFSEND